MKTQFCGIKTMLAAFWVAAGLALSASAQGTPNFTVDPANDRLWGNQWPTGGVVTVTLGSAPGQTVGTASVDDWGNWYLWNIGPNDIQPGMLVTADDGSTSIQHTVKFLAVSEVDIDNDTVSGVAEPGSAVQVAAVDMGSYQNMFRNVWADGGGNWVADFSVAVGENPEDAAFDITHGSSGWAGQSDNPSAPYGATQDGWRVPKPYFHVEALSDSVWGGEWPTGSVVTVMMGEAPGQLVGTGDVDEWGNWSLWNSGVAIQAGDVVTVSNGSLVVSHTVTSLTITEVNPGSDVIRGTAEPGSWVQAAVSDYQQVSRDVQADEAGNWVADFSVAVGEDPEDAPYDIRYGTSGWASQGDGAPEPYGSTYVQWNVPRPYFRVDPAQDYLNGGDWPPEGQVSVAVGDPVEFSSTASTDSVGHWELWDIGFDIQSGDVVTVSNDTLVIAYTVTSLTVAGVDAGLDVIQGTAEPGSWVNVDINANQWIQRDVQSDEEGNWTADFSVASGGESWGAAFDIEKGTDGSATQEGDTSVPYGSTQIHWRAVNPFFHMNPRSHAIWGSDWPAGATVTILVGDPENPDYSAEVNSDPGGSWWLEDDENPIVLALGAQVQATCGAYVKTGIVEFVQVFEVDGDADVVRGTAAPGCSLLVNIDNADAGREVQTDAGGQWEADFSTAAGGENWDREIDIAQGTQGVALIQDEDGDGTLAPWRWSNEPTEASIVWFEGVRDGYPPYNQFSVGLGGSGIVSARIGTPLDGWYDLAVENWFGESWSLQVYESTFEALDAVFPVGEYRLEIVGASGVSTTAVTVAQSLERPNQLPVIVSPQTDVAWPEAYLQWDAPTTPNFGATIVQVRDDSEDFDYETQFSDVSISEVLVSGLEPDKDYDLSVIFANFSQIETNGIPFEIARVTFAEMQFTTGLNSDPTLTNRVSWYAGRGVGRGPGESWEFLEGRDRFGKGMTLQQEYVADTDPLDPDSVFRIESVDLGPPIAVQVFPSSSARVYTLQRRASLHEGQWDAVPGQVDLLGDGGELCDNADPGDGFFYRVQVEVP